MPDAPDPDMLRQIAQALDFYDRVTTTVMESIVSGGQLGADEVTVTLQITDGDRGPLSPENAAKVLDWIEGDTMQRDLRRWADALDDRDA